MENIYQIYYNAFIVLESRFLNGSIKVVGNQKGVYVASTNLTCLCKIVWD